MQKHGNSEKADYLQIGDSNINIYSKNKGLCLGRSIDSWGGGECHKHFCHKSGGGGGDFFCFKWDWERGGGGRKIFCTSHENVTGPQLVINDSSSYLSGEQGHDKNIPTVAIETLKWSKGSRLFAMSLGACHDICGSEKEDEVGRRDGNIPSVNVGDGATNDTCS